MKADSIKELDSVINGLPWYGPSVIEVLQNADTSRAFTRIGRGHTMAELLLHMIAWTEEVSVRLDGKIGGDPERGDWPDPAGLTWPELISMLLRAHEELLAALSNFPEERLDDIVIYEQEQPEPVTFRQTLSGLAQHHAYHIGQIAILNRQLQDD